MRTFLFTVAFALTACGRTETAEVAEVVKQAVESVREKQRVVIQVRLDASAMPSDEDLQTRRDLEERNEVDRIGQVVESRAGIGYYDITVEVDSTADAVPRIEAMLRESNLRERAVVRVAQ